MREPSGVLETRHSVLEARDSCGSVTTSCSRDRCATDACNLFTRTERDGASGFARTRPRAECFWHAGRHASSQSHSIAVVLSLWRLTL